MSAIEVLVPGFLTTVQDHGRPGFAALGVSASGAADPIALRVGNRLVGNDAGAAALEATLVGGRFRFERAGWIALTGSATAARLNARSIAPWRAHPVLAGDELAIGPLAGGARAYLCVRGGIDGPRVLGSASTHLASGLCGRRLAQGDRVAIGAGAAREPLERVVDPSLIPGYGAPGPFRIVDGPQAPWFSAEARATLVSAEWMATEACDRMGLRLDGPSLEPPPRELTTEGAPLGSIQLPPAGRPIILFVEHQTTGGYPKIGCVIGADHARLGQVRPRRTLRFARIEPDEAVRLLRQQERAIEELLS